MGSGTGKVQKVGKDDEDRLGEGWQGSCHRPQGSKRSEHSGDNVSRW